LSVNGCDSRAAERWRNRRWVRSGPGCRCLSAQALEDCVGEELQLFLQLWGGGDYQDRAVEGPLGASMVGGGGSGFTGQEHAGREVEGPAQRGVHGAAQSTGGDVLQ